MMPARFLTSALTVIAVGAAVVLSLLGLAAPAQATGNHAGGTPGVRAGTPSVIDSSAFAGYQTPVPVGSASAVARFKVPRLRCTSAYRGITPVAGLDVGLGVSYSSASAFVGCSHGKALYFPVMVINEKQINFTGTPLHAGNLIVLVTVVTVKRTTVTVTDLSTHVTWKRTGTGAHPSRAFVGDSIWVPPHQLQLGVPDFRTLVFTRCAVNGKALGRWHPAKYQRTLLGIVQISTGALTSGGTEFPTYFRHS
jgi:hypothetical protein